MKYENTPPPVDSRDARPGIPVPADSVYSPIWSGGGPEGTWHIGRLQTVYPPVGAVGNGHKQRDWKPGNHGDFFIQASMGRYLNIPAMATQGGRGGFDSRSGPPQQQENNMNDMLDRDYDMGIPFDVDESMERAWARMDESYDYDDGGDDEE